MGVDRPATLITYCDEVVDMYSSKHCITNSEARFFFDISNTVKFPLFVFGFPWIVTADDYRTEVIGSVTRHQSL